MTPRPALSLCLATTLIGLIATAASAQNGVAVARADVNGNIPRFCALGEPVIDQSGPRNNIRTVNGSIVAVESLADPATLTTRAANVSLNLPTVCNTAHRITLASDNNGLWREPAVGPEPAGFSGAVPYQLQMNWAGQRTELDAEAQSRSVVDQVAIVDKPTVGDLGLTFSIRAGATGQATNTPLLAGIYRDTVRLTVEAQ